MSKTWGKVTANGSDDFIALVRLALDEAKLSPVPLETAIARNYTIEQHSNAEFRAAGYILPNDITAEGHVVGGDKLWVNGRIVNRKPKRARHIVRHELAHVLPLTAQKKTDVMALMAREDGTHPTTWKGGGYLGRANECYADTMAEAMSGIDSPWDDFAYYRLDVADADLPKFLDITFRADTTPVEPDPPPDPLPPISPDVVAVQAQLDAANQKIAAAREVLA